MKSSIIVVAAAAFACGGTSGGSTSVSGTVGGASLGSVVDTQAVVVTNGSCDNSHPTGNLLIVVLSSTAGVCADVTAAKSPPNTTSLQLLVSTFWVNPSTTGAAPPANSPALELNKAYPINGNINTATKDANGFGVVATAGFDSTDATCNSKLASGGQNATSGSVTLTSLSSSGVSGTFSLTFSSGTLTGSFSSGNCGLGTAQICALLGTQSTCG